MEDKLAKCRYYKGEEKCPYIDPALVLWWSLEEKSIEEQDEVDGDLLTPTMTRYIYGHHYEGVLHPISWEECLKRCSEMYHEGTWLSSYATIKDSRKPDKNESTR